MSPDIAVVQAAERNVSKKTFRLLSPRLFTPQPRKKLVIRTDRAADRKGVCPKGHTSQYS
jgi:hypothetical protein